MGSVHLCTKSRTPGNWISTFNILNTPTQSFLQHRKTQIRRHITKFKEAAESAHRESVRYQHLEVTTRLPDDFARLPIDFAEVPKMVEVSFPVSMVNMHRNFTFIGREDDLNHVHELLSKAKQADADTASEADKTAHTKTSLAACVPHGLGGIGKTRIALEYTYRYREDYDAILWLAAEHDWTLTSTYARIADTLGLLDAKTFQDQTDKRQNLAIEKSREWLATTSKHTIKVSTPRFTSSFVHRSNVAPGL